MSYLNPAPGPCAFFVYLRALLFVVLHQQPLMVRGTSSSKSNRSQSKSTHAGPPTKKTDAVSMAKEKKTRQQSIKKPVRTGKYFLLSGCASDVELDQMKMQNLAR